MRLYIGIDAGWESMRYEVRNEKDHRIKRGGIVATPEALEKLLKTYEKVKDVQVAFESGTQMYWMDKVVKQMGMDSYPFHAAHFFPAGKSKNKTDKKDAERIAHAAVKRNLPERIGVPEEGERQLREKMSEREGYKKELTTLANRLHALTVSQGLAIKKGRLTENAESWEAVIDQLNEEARPKAKRLYTVALSLMQVLERLEDEIREMMEREDWKPAFIRVTSIPGIGFWSAVVLLAWCGPQATRFKSSRQAAAYFGLVGKAYQSGKTNRMGHITKAGPPVARRIFTQAAYAFLRSEGGKSSRWGEWYDQFTDGRTRRKKIAIVGLTRKIVTAAVACLRNETVWDDSYLEEAG